MAEAAVKITRVVRMNAPVVKGMTKLKQMSERSAAFDRNQAPDRR